MDETLDDFLHTCAALRAEDASGEADGELVLATLVEASGSGKALGRRAWFLPGGEIRGSVTLGGCADGRLRQVAAEVRARGERQRVRVDLGSDEAYEFGMTCAGQAEVLLEPLSPAAPVWQEAARRREAGEGLTLLTPLGRPGPTTLAPLPEKDAHEQRAERVGHGADEVLREVWPAPFRLLIVGSGPVARPLARLARTLGMRVSLTDDHPERLTPERWPDVHTFYAVDNGQELTLPPLDARSAVVILVHDYAHELSVLGRVLDSPVPYLALLASRRRGGAVLRFLADTGLDPAQLGRVRTPAGLDLGMSSPAGIALSILSELVQVVQGGSARPLAAHDWQRPAPRPAGELEPG